MFLRHLVPWPSVDIHGKFCRDRLRGTPPAGGLNARGVAKYSSFGPVEGCISETVQDWRLVSINGPLVHPNNLNFKRLCMGDKVSPCSVSNILNSWSHTVSRITYSCTGNQAESNKLFFIIIKCDFVEIFRKFQRHCFYRFPLELQLPQLRERPQHLLVMVRRGGCDSTASLVTIVVAAMADIPRAADVSLAENLSSQCVNQTCKAGRHSGYQRHRRH